MSVMEDGRPNLAVINEAFGPHADLYINVLQVQPNAGSEQIQEAYFDRRNELFQLLADIDYADTEQDSITESHRRHAERKMDAVVCAVRILGDPGLRLQYDDLRTDRMKGSPKRISPNKRSTPPDSRLTSLLQQHRLEQQHNSSQSSTASDLSSRLFVPGMNSASNPAKVSAYYSKSRMNSAMDGGLRSPAGYDDDDEDDDQPPPVPRRTATANRPPSRSKPHVTTTTAAVSKHVPLVSPQSQKLPLRASSQPQILTANNSKRKSNASRSGSVRSLDEDGSTLSMGSTTFISDDEEETQYTVDDASAAESVIITTASKKKHGLVDRIRMEIIGALDDTTRSFEQVLNAFTLQEDDIKAVMGRIDKAKRQIATTHILYPAAEEKEAPLSVTSGRKSPSKVPSSKSSRKSKR